MSQLPKLSDADRELAWHLADEIASANPKHGVLTPDMFDDMASVGFNRRRHRVPSARFAVYLPDNWPAVKQYVTELLASRADPEVSTGEQAA